MNITAGISFPLTFVMKIIMNVETEPGANRTRLEGVFDDLLVLHADWREKTSGAGRYVSYSVCLTAPDRERFEGVHERIAKIPGVRYIL